MGEAGIVLCVAGVLLAAVGIWLWLPAVCIGLMFTVLGLRG